MRKLTDSDTVGRLTRIESMLALVGFSISPALGMAGFVWRSGMTIDWGALVFAMAVVSLWLVFVEAVVVILRARRADKFRQSMVAVSEITEVEGEKRAVAILETVMPLLADHERRIRGLENTPRWWDRLRGR